MTTTEHLIALLELATGPNKSGNPYGHAPVKDALNHLAGLQGGGDWTDALDEARRRRAAGEDTPSSAVVALGKVRAGLRCNYDAALIAYEFGAEIDDALGGPDSRGPLDS